MNKRPSLLNFIIFAFLAAVLTISLSAELFARAGKSGGSSSRSSSSSRSYGSSSRSYGSSSSYGRSSSSYGSGYGSSSYGSGYGSSSYGYGGGYRRSYGSSYGSSGYYGRSGGSVLSTIIIIAVIAVIVIVVFAFIKSRSSSDGGDYASSGLFGSGGSYGSGYGSAASSFSGSGYNYGRSAVRNPEAEARVRHVFNAVQRAWAERDQYIASDCMSESMFREHKTETDEMISRRERNVLENIVINEIVITKFSDTQSSSGYDSGLEPASSYGSSGRSVMEARISASMIDYVIDENTGSVIDGDANVPDRFTETWRFIKNENGWVLDEIV